jgi:oxygen-independent coproporphyrinogen-3 oxidase
VEAAVLRVYPDRTAVIVATPREKPSPREADRALTLAERLAGTPYDSYLYAYPHKTAYRAFEPARRLDEVWRDEDRSALFLYLHVPFCEMRCGFCNLFTTPKPQVDVVTQFVDVLERQARRVAGAIGPSSYARFAMGGGTPTLLEADALARVLDVAEGIMGANLANIPGSVETSPETCTPAKMKVLRDRGIDRVSMGVQSFIEAESAAVKRRQNNVEVFAALAAMREARFPILNVDLMYGLPGQTPATWEQSLRTALEWKPEELYLYPLYVRPVTTLSRRPRDWDDERLGMYRLARDLLIAEGYDQHSMRMFRRRGGDDVSGPVYCVQDDGMVGLGPGARSYTRGLHYSTEWAVGARSVREILGAWLDETDDGFDVAHWGMPLDAEEQRRRWVAYALFVADGLDRAAYRACFGSDVYADLPALEELSSLGCAVESNGKLALTALGIERSDTIGPWLYSDDVRARMRGFALR